MIKRFKAVLSTMVFLMVAPVAMAGGFSVGHSWVNMPAGDNEAVFIEGAIPLFAGVSLYGQAATVHTVDDSFYNIRNDAGMIIGQQFDEATAAIDDYYQGGFKVETNPGESWSFFASVAYADFTNEGGGSFDATLYGVGMKAGPVLIELQQSDHDAIEEIVSVGFNLAF